MMLIKSFAAFNSGLVKFIQVSQESLPRIFREPADPQSTLDLSQPPSRRSGAMARPEGGERNCPAAEEPLLPPSTMSGVGRFLDLKFNELALALFTLQFARVEPYRRLCEAGRITPEKIAHWSEIPAIPASAFKELDLSSLPVAERTSVFHSSGTRTQQPSRHFHNAESLSIYEASLMPWFSAHLLPDFEACGFVMLTPSPALAPHSSLVWMFETVRRELGSRNCLFTGKIDSTGAWTLDSDAALETLRQSMETEQPIALLGTAFSFVHLLDHLSPSSIRFALPAGSRAMETGGYKGRSRSLPRAELHALITRCLGIPPSHIVSEYGMSELSSQAYDRVVGRRALRFNASTLKPIFHFPPWARARVVCPETGGEVAEGETGLIRVCDLANVRSVMVIQTEDLAVRRGDGFELLGRAEVAEPRGCSLMNI